MDNKNKLEKYFLLCFFPSLTSFGNSKINTLSDLKANFKVVHLLAYKMYPINLLI